MSETLLAMHRPESLVCFGPGGTRDAAQFSAYARAIAAALPSAETANAAVVLACTDRYRFSAALLAAWLRGYVAELPANGQPETVHELARAPHVVALLHDRADSVRPQHGIDVSALELERTRAELPLSLALASDAPALAVYTSGSTGAPKAHYKTLQQLLAEPRAHVAGFALQGTRIVAAVPPYHIYGLLFGVLVPLLSGGSMSRSAPLQPAELLRELARDRAEVLIAVPPQLTALVQSGPEALPALRRVFSSAAPLPAETSRTLAQRGWRVTEILGSTETGGIAQRSESMAAWQPLPGVKIAIADDGTLWVDSPWLAPEGQRPLATADRVEASEGGFRHLGRSDAVVKIGGRRIDLGELEARLKQLPGVRDARVLTVPSTRMRGLDVLAVVEADDLRAEQLRRALAGRIDPVALPRRYRFVRELPRSPQTGKITRAALLALFDDWTFPREELPDQRVRYVVPALSGYFRGHFDGQPILPGVVQLQHLALAEARRRFPELGALTRMSRVKFKRLVAPGETLELTLVQKNSTTISFALQVAGAPAASGLFHFRAKGEP